MRALLTGSVAAAVLIAVPAMAQTPFYKGKNLTVVIGYTPGGGYDSYGRLLSRHIGHHIDGAPNVVVQNLPGAGSLNAVRQVEATMAKDGTYMVAFNPALILDSLVNPDAIKFNFSESTWIGSIAPEVRVCYTWGGTGIKTWDEMAAKKEVNFGSTARGTTNFINAAVLRKVFNMPVKHVLGFPGSAELKLALERGELDADCGTWSSIPPEWIADKKINPIVTFAADQPDLPKDLPYIGKFVKTIEQKELLDIFGASGDLGRPIIVSKQVPADRVKILRDAFDATMKDPEFLADAKKMQLPIQAIDGARSTEIIKHVYQASKETIAKVREITE